MKLAIFPLIVLLLFASFQGTAQEDAKVNTDKEFGHDYSEVKVVNVQVPVRVFLKNKPVAGLKKEDFKIFEDGKEKEIAGFYSIRKKLKQEKKSTAFDRRLSQFKPSRLFLLIFNTSDYNSDLSSGIDNLFNNVLRKGDRLMVISNTLFMDERVIKDPEREKQQVKNILEQETKNLKKRFAVLNEGTRKIMSELNNLFNFYDKLKATAWRGYITNAYVDQISLFREFRNQYFNMTLKQYVKTANYLRRQKGEKWVLSFYQKDFLLKPQAVDASYKITTRYSDLSGYILRAASGTLKRMNKTQTEMISKLFINTGATFHTMVIEPFQDNSTSRILAVKSTTSNTEKILRNISRLTGGKVVKTSNISKFVDKISEVEDITYFLTYIPDSDYSKNSKIKVTVGKNKGYDVIYDKNKKPLAIKKALAALEPKTPPVKIEAVGFKNNFFVAIIDGIKTIPSDPFARNDERIGNLRVRLVVLDPQSRTLFDTTRKFKPRKVKSMLQMELPELGKGNYNFILEITDLLSFKTDIRKRSMQI